LCRHLGFETIVDEAPGTFPAGFPMSQIGIYVGWYAENVCGPFAEPRVEFLPGAFAYHLHSFSAASLRSTTQNWCGPLLAKGVTATMGTVDEPYLPGTPDMSVFVSRLIYFGFSFGEAALASQPVLSWQTIAVGDPLYRPFGKPPDELHRELAERKSPQAEWSHLRWVNLNLANGKPLTSFVRYLEELDLTPRSAVLTEKLGDLYLREERPTSALQAWALATGRHPSEQQHIRLILKMAEQFTSLKREADAYEQLKKLLERFPDYPDKPAVQERLRQLSLKLERTDAVPKPQSATKN
jgi:hypothetical protein